MAQWYKAVKILLPAGTFASRLRNREQVRRRCGGSVVFEGIAAKLPTRLGFAFLLVVASELVPCDA